MIKRNLILLTLFLTFMSVDAQITVPEKGSVWIYKYSNIGSSGPVLATYRRDSLIDGKSTIVLDETFYDTYRDPGKPNIDTIVRLGSILYIEDSTVFYWNTNQFDTLYDFGSEVGDEWPYYFTGMQDTLKAIVQSKGVNSNLGAFIEVEYIDKYKRPWKDTIYETLLGGSKYILPWDETEMRLDGHQGGPLQCFSNRKGSYSEQIWTDGGKACTDIIEKLDVTEIAKTNLFTIYPNPSKGIIRIDATQKPEKMEAYTVLGELVYSSAHVFETPHLTSQLYVVKLWRSDGLVEVHWVVVE